MSNAESKNCPQCGAPIDAIARTCKFCGAEIAVQPQYQSQVQTPQYTPIQAPQYQTPQYAPIQAPQYQIPQTYNLVVNTSGKSKTTAGILAILLGGLGVHKFYLGQTGKGILYLLFCWTYIPAILGVIEGITYLTSSDEKFYSKYVKN